MPRLSDYAVKQKQGIPDRLDSILNQDVIITDVVFTKSQFGEVSYMTVTVKATGEVKRIMAGAMLVLDALHHVMDEGTLPIEAKFSKKGRVFIIE